MLIRIDMIIDTEVYFSMDELREKIEIHVEEANPDAVLRQFHVDHIEGYEVRK